ncbi:hypothetical protein JTY60_00735 [symbiont of Argiope bruennichi]|uniref:hypothetical protein n=1 Tax=symbiont of Argiope bruennichi TaxID=2810479 RepID=UPI003DA62F8B
MYHIAKNILKNIFTLKVQFISLVFLIVIFISVFSSFTQFYSLTNQSFKNFVNESNPSLFYLDISNSKFNKGAGSNNIFDGKEPWSKDYAQSESTNQSDIGLDNIVSTLSCKISNLFPNSTNICSPDSIKKFDLKNAAFNVFFRDTRFFKDGFKSYKIINLDDNLNLSNRVELLAGRTPQWSDEILLEPNYAYKNNLKINSYFKINTELFHVVGYATSFDFSYPYESSDNFLNNNKFNCLVYTYKNAYYYLNSHLPGKFLIANSNQREIYLYGSVKDKSNLKIFDQKRNEIKKVINEILTKNNIKYNFYFYDDTNYPFYQRTHFFSTFIYYFYYFEIFFIILIMTTIFLIFYNIFLKRLSQESSSIRNFYYLGFSIRTIITTYLIFPTIIFLSAVYVSLFTSILINVFLIHIFSNFFVIPIKFSFSLFFYIILGV